MDFGDYARSLARRWQGRDRAALVALESSESTHLLARRIVDEYGREGLTPPPVDLLAWEQTAGIGRLQHPWSSPAGRGIYGSSIRTLDADGQAADVQRLPLRIAVAVGELLNRRVGCRLKWPNDLYVGERKLGGILIDVASPAGRRKRAADSSAEDDGGGGGQRPKAVAVISLGLNVSRNVEVFGVPGATSLEAETPSEAPIGLGGLAWEMADAIDAGLARPVPPDELIGRYCSLSLHRPGEELHCRLESEDVRGVFLGFDRLGFLRLEVLGEERRLSSGILVDD